MSSTPPAAAAAPKRYFVVDVEATSPTPYSGVMTELGVVDLATGDTLYAHLWPFTPHPDEPALPVVAPDATPDPYLRTTTTTATTDPDVGEALAGAELKLTGDHAPTDGHLTRPDSLTDLARAVHDWIGSHPGIPVFVSDNPAFDFMWVADHFDRHGLTNPFGYTGRRIGDLAAGLAGDWLRTSDWKQLRRTVHDHNPANDARGNAEALEELLTRHRQRR